jgi:hypothetical protein
MIPLFAPSPAFCGLILLHLIPLHSKGISL